MLPTPLVNKTARSMIVAINLLWLMAASTAVISAYGRLTGQSSQSIPTLDLTAEAPPDEQGFYHGIPGSSGGGATGGWRPGPGDTVPYRLPLSLEILRATPNKDGNFVFEILVRNIDKAAFDLPSSPNLTTIEKPGNKSRRVFFFQLQPLSGSKPGIVALGSAATAGSTSLPGSFVRLDPGKSLKILLLASSNLISGSFRQQPEKLAVKVICNEWRLDDNRFFLSGISAELASANTIQFVQSGNGTAQVQP